MDPEETNSFPFFFLITFQVCLTFVCEFMTKINFFLTFLTQLYIKDSSSVEMSLNYPHLGRAHIIPTKPCPERVWTPKPGLFDLCDRSVPCPGAVWLIQMLGSVKVHCECWFSGSREGAIGWFKYNMSAPLYAAN